MSDPDTGAEHRTRDPEPLEAFREHVRTWLETEVPESRRGMGPIAFGDGVWGGRRWDWDADPDAKVYLDRMAEQGWTAPTWPKAYGGGGLSNAEASVLQQEMKRLRLPPPLIGFGLRMIGPTLLRYGDEAQKKRHLPPIVRGEIRWCQGYSEPGAGSDLASLQTKARRDGDAFVVTGQKVWTSYADVSDWIFCLVRTANEGPKQHGITFLLIDMDSDGISTRPIPLISGASPFCEVFFEDVRASVDDVVGEIDEGWTIAKALLGFEREMIGEIFGREMRKAARSDALVEQATEVIGLDGDGRLADPVLRDALARLQMDFAAFALVLQRVARRARHGDAPGAESSILKVAGTELNQRRKAMAVRIAGPQALGWEGVGFTDDELSLAREWLRSRGNTIEGGTSEIQLNIIARRVLGLP